jgi:hypothetical protein
MQSVFFAFVGLTIMFNVSLLLKMTVETRPSSNRMPSAMAAVSSSSGGGGRTPQQFTDAELSDIFQINFSEIFGSAADMAASAQSPGSGYRGIQLPSPKSTHRSRG